MSLFKPRDANNLFLTHCKILYLPNEDARANTQGRKGLPGQVFKSKKTMYSKCTCLPRNRTKFEPFNYAQVSKWWYFVPSSQRP